VIKRLSIILPLLFALLSFKVNASILVFTGGVVSTEAQITQKKENAIHHWVDNEEQSNFNEFIEEEEEQESAISLHFSFNFSFADLTTSKKNWVF